MCVGVIIIHSIYQRQQPQNSPVMENNTSSELTEAANPRRRESSSGLPECVFGGEDEERVSGQQGAWLDGWLVS